MTVLRIFYVILFLIPSQIIYADKWEELIELKGVWKFNIGDNLEWATHNYDDSDWDEIKVPSSWEDQGYHGYNGYAWYRKKFRVPNDIIDKTLYISLGYIDDVDEVYLNGQLIGSSGSFPPDYNTAYNAFRKYPINSDLLKVNEENLISVRVFDAELSGGILSGDISIMVLHSVNLEINLDGYWKFNLGDNQLWKETHFVDEKWKDIIVPSKWDIQGYDDYDGFAWYRKTFYLDMSLEDEDLVLILGKIDDIDQCFINGKMIGSTGDFVITPETNNFNNEWLELRGYYIPKELLKFGEYNVIAVRVYDGFYEGGIYQGPIGIAVQDEYRKYWKERKRKRNFWDYLFDN